MRHGRGIFGGVVLIGIGVVWLLNNLGLLAIRDIWRFWPVLLVVWGIGIFLRPEREYRNDNQRPDKNGWQTPPTDHDNRRPPEGGSTWQRPTGGSWQPPQGNTTPPPPTNTTGGSWQATSGSWQTPQGNPPQPPRTGGGWQAPQGPAAQGPAAQGPPPQGGGWQTPQPPRQDPPAPPADGEPEKPQE